MNLIALAIVVKVGCYSLTDLVGPTIEKSTAHFNFCQISRLLHGLLKSVDLSSCLPLLYILGIY